MLISYRHKFIFVHVYRTGGTSIASALKPYAYHPETLLINRVAHKLPHGLPLRWPHYQWRVLPVHSTLEEIRSHVPAQVFASSFKFAFVRNPWDWQVSLYHYMLDKQEHYQHAEVSELGSFEEYLAWRFDGRKQLQLEFVTDPTGAPLADFVGRFEQIEADFTKICACLNLDVRLPHLNHSAHRPYTHYYTAATRKLVARQFEEDIDYFGYIFA